MTLHHWKDWRNVPADIETDSTVTPERFACPQCGAPHAQQDTQDAFDFSYEGLDEYPQCWRRSWVRCRECRHQYLVDDERPAT